MVDKYAAELLVGNFTVKIAWIRKYGMFERTF